MGLGICGSNTTATTPRVRLGEEERSEIFAANRTDGLFRAGATQPTLSDEVAKF